jgi:hypothetical protein
MPRLSKHHRKYNTLMASGLAGVNVIAIVQLASTNTLSWPLTIGVFCFAVSIPLLAATVVVLSEHEELPEMHQTFHYAVLLLGGSFLSLAGIAALFFHLNYAAGGAFLITVISAALLIIKHDAENDLIKKTFPEGEHLKSTTRTGG